MPQFPELSLTDKSSMQEGDLRFSQVLIALFRGVLYQEAQEDLFVALLSFENAVRDYVAVLGLELALDEAEGYAYLRNAQTVEQQAALPKLVAKRPLSFTVSLVLALLRQRLLEAETSGQMRLILTRSEIVEMVRVYLPNRTNEAALIDRVQKTAINKIIELGFLRQLRGQDQVYEVLRIIKAFVDAEWLADFDEKLSTYVESSGLVRERKELNQDV